MWYCAYGTAAGRRGDLREKRRGHASKCREKERKSEEISQKQEIVLKQENCELGVMIFRIYSELQM